MSCSTASSSFNPPRHVVIVGAGAIGMSIGWRLAQVGTRVTLLERDRAGTGATHAAAGMLAASAEAEPGEEALTALGRASLALWPAFAAELEAASGISVDLRTEGTLVVAMNADDQAKARHHLDFQQALGLPVSWISAAEARRREPYLAPGLVGALWSPEDHQVDNRQLAAALRIAVERAGATLREGHAVRRVVIEDGRARGVVLADGNRIDADAVVLAAGPWSRTIEGLPESERPPVRPVKGQMIALRMDPAAPVVSHVVWAPGIYLVPRRDGRLILGGTVEERGFDTTLTAGGVLSLLEAAWRAVPAVEELAIDEMWVGHRPGSRDDAPVLGASATAGLFHATGHHRNGILLTPVTAQAISRLVLDGTADAMLRDFSIGRFVPRSAAAE